MTPVSHKSGRWVILPLVVFFFVSGCRAGIDGPPTGSSLKLSLAVSPAIYSGLIAVADQMLFFQKAGLDVSLLTYPSGLEALKAMSRGDVEVATVADIAFSAEIFKNPDIRILASIGTTAGSKIVARKDRGIQTPSDLRGKRIGFSKDTVSDYFLHTYLLIENISPKEVALVDVAPVRQVEALLSGEVDAVSAFEIYALEVAGRLGANAVSWSSQNNLGYHWLLAINQNTAKSAEALKRLLKALLMASAYVHANEVETKRLIIRKWGYDPAFVDACWSKTRLEVSLNQSVITSLRDFVRWKMKKAGINADPPDVLEYLYTDIMDEVAPGLVTIFR